MSKRNYKVAVDLREFFYVEAEDEDEAKEKACDEMVGDFENRIRESMSVTEYILNNPNNKGEDK